MGVGQDGRGRNSISRTKEVAKETVPTADEKEPVAKQHRPTTSSDTVLRLGEQWAIFEGCGETRPPTVISSSRTGVLQGGICARVWRPGVHLLGHLAPAGDGILFERPLASLRLAILGSPERPDRDDLPKYDRVASLDMSPDGEVAVSQEDGVVARLQLGGVAWLKTDLQHLNLDSRFTDAYPQSRLESVGCRKAGAVVFCEGILPGVEYSKEEDVIIGVLPADCRPQGGRRCYLGMCSVEGIIHLFRIYLDASGRITARRSHTQGRAKDGHIFEVAKRQPGQLEVALGSVRFATELGAPLNLLADAKAPRQYAARKQLAYLGLGLQNDDCVNSPGELDGFQVATCTRHQSVVVLDGAVVLTVRHRYTAFARLPHDCHPSQSVTVLVARGLPNGRFVPERLDITDGGELLCPQLPEEQGVEHIIHLSGAVFGVPFEERESYDKINSPIHSEDSYDRWNWSNSQWQDAGWQDKGSQNWDYHQGSGKGHWKAYGQSTEEREAWRRLQDLESRDRRFRRKFTSSTEFMEFEKYLQWFRAHDCTESHRLTHSCFKGRSDFTQTGMLVFDTEEDLEGLNQAVAWLYKRRIPVVLMERQTRIFPMIFDIDLKCTRKETIDAVPDRIKKARPWQGDVDFCRWHGADWLVLGKDMELLRHLARIIFQFFPDLPLLDFCIFNASGWDRVKDCVKVSLHIVAPYVLVTPERLCNIRERMLEYLGECSQYPGHHIHGLLNDFLAESEDNTWEKVVDQTVTSGTNGLRMPFCDKAQRVLKREFQERKKRGELLTERELMDRHAYLREEAGRPCLPEGILRMYPIPQGADEFALPEVKWMCRGDDLPIDEWIRLGRCRHAWRMPLAPPGPTPWRPPLRYQWAEPSALWEDRAELKGSPVVRRFGGSAEEFRKKWDQYAGTTSLHGYWLSSATGARWRGGLQEESSHEVRFVHKAGRVVLLLSPEPGAARAFAEIRNVLSGWTLPDTEACVPLCGSPSDAHSAALHTIIVPSDDFPTVQEALDAVPVDEPLHRVTITGGIHMLDETLLLRRPVMLEGEGNWETTLRTRGVPVIRFEGDGAKQAMIRNLRIELLDHPKRFGGAAIEMDFSSCSKTSAAPAAAVESDTEMDTSVATAAAEPAVVGCMLYAAGRWGTCLHCIGGAPQIVRSHFSSARWGAVLVGADGRIEDNEFLGLGESGLILVGGAPWLHRNIISDCGGAGVITAAECHAVLEGNEIRDSLVGVRVIGNRAEIEMRAGNRLLHNGLCDEHQLEAPSGVIPAGVTYTVRSCRPYPFLPKDKDSLLERLRDCNDAAELTIIVRKARRDGLFEEAVKAHERLVVLRQGCKKGPPASHPPSAREVLVVNKAWDGKAQGYDRTCAVVEPGTLCEVHKKDPSGWVLVETSRRSVGWCSPHVIG